MITKVFHFCDKLEKKLVQFIKEFNNHRRTEEEVTKLKSEYEKIRETLTKITKLTNINTTQLINPGTSIEPSYDIV